MLDDLVFLGPLFAAIGAASAGGTLALARRGEDRALLEGGLNPGERELGKREPRKGLGGG